MFIERRAVEAPVAAEVVEARPTGFWRGRRYYEIRWIFGRRIEQDARYYRVRTNRGCFEVRHTIVRDPWTWEARSEWAITAALTVVWVPTIPAQVRW